MKKTLSVIIRIASLIVGRRNFERLLIFAAKSIDVNLHQHGLLQIGAGTGVYLENGSEVFFIKNILADMFKNEKAPLFFDVGANIGIYTLSLKKYLSNADVYAFEPVKETFEQLEINIDGKARAFNIGFGKVPGKGLLYNTVSNVISEITTTHQEVLRDIFKSPGEIAAIEFEIDTIDNFCSVHNIKDIDFLKIDVEGNELQVLQGASAMLSNGAIKLIQFEFNTHNVYARVFLRDFYLLLPDFDFFRLNQHALVRLGNYSAGNEIFTAQNILAVHKSISSTINSKYFSAI